jgi:hypothetical protein
LWVRRDQPVDERFDGATFLGVKYTQGPGCTAVGGVPAFGVQGKLSFTTPAKTELVENSNVMAVLSSRSRRRTPDWNRDGRDIALPASSTALSWSLSAIIGPPCVRNTYDELSS